MTQVDDYLDTLNEDFSFVNKVFKLNVISKMTKGVTDSIKGKRVNKNALQKALKPLPVVAPEKIDIMLTKYLPNYKHNKTLAKNHFNKKYPDKPNNDTAATVAGIITAADDTKTIQNSIKDVDRVYSRGGSGGGAFVLMMIGLLTVAGAFSIENLEFKNKALAIALGSLLVIASFKSLAS